MPPTFEDAGPRFSRRAAIAASAVPLVGLSGHGLPDAAPAPPATVRVDVGDPAALPFHRAEHTVVGVYDVDWLTRPGFARLLDNLAASPGAFSGVRVFGPFTAGTPERLMPEGGGTVWPSPDAPIDLSATLDALAALASRGLTPLVALGFFPPAVSPSPIRPPIDWARWRTLVRTFFEALAADPRLGAEAIAGWWFEAWNEPNEGRFWSGTQEDYHALYGATSEAVAATGLPVRLGGPAIAYKPQASPDDGAPWMRRFLTFVAADPDLRCDVLSLHRKGTVGDDPPDPRRLLDAAAETAALVRELVPERAAGLTILNDEADEKVGFEVPYAPRLDERGAAWLAATTVVSATLTAQHRDAGLTFAAAADNANLQLVEAPFDGRRSLMTLATPTDLPPGDATDLLKLPVYAGYELIRLLGERHLPVTEGAAHVFPATDLYHLATASEHAVAILLAHYPDVARAAPTPRVVHYVAQRAPWQSVNVALFRVDAVRSNAYAAAGGSSADPFPVPDPARLGTVRQAQELALARPVAHGVALVDGIYRETLTLEPYTTALLWITPSSLAVPAGPAWFETVVEGDNTVVRWEPSREPAFFSYELFAVEGDAPGERLTPLPMRAALWVDTGAPPDRRYAVRAVSASGVAGAWTASG